MGRVCNRNSVKNSLTDSDGFTCIAFCRELNSVITGTRFGPVPIGDPRARYNMAVRTVISPI
jgi:hypothetical protein